MLIPWRGVSHSALVAALLDVSRRLAQDAGAWRALTLKQLLEFANYMAKVQTNVERSVAY